MVAPAATAGLLVSSPVAQQAPQPWEQLTAMLTAQQQQIAARTQAVAGVVQSQDIANLGASTDGGRQSAGQRATRR